MVLIIFLRPALEYQWSFSFPYYCLFVCLKAGFLFPIIISRFSFCQVHIFNFLLFILLLFYFSIDTTELCDLLLYTVIFLNYNSFFIYCFLKQTLFKIKINLIRIKWQKQCKQGILNAFILLWSPTGHLLTQVKSLHLWQQWLQGPTK